MNKRYPSTQSMMAFVHVAQLGSFSGAARALNLTHSAISQQVHTLEDFIGQPLFAREGRGIRLTHAGQLFARVLPEGLAHIDRALTLVRDHQVKPTRLAIAVDNELSQAWLNARLPDLLDALPGYTVAFNTVTGAAEQVTKTVDLSLRYGYGEWRDEEFVMLCADEVIAVAAPALLERYQLLSPVAAEQILQLPLLGYTRRSWIPWLNAAGLEPLEPDSVAVFDNVADLVAAAKAGVGVGLVRSLLARDALRSGQLQKLTDVEVPASYNLYAVWPRGRGDQVAAVVEVVRRLANDG